MQSKVLGLWHIVAFEMFVCMAEVIPNEFLKVEWELRVFSVVWIFWFGYCSPTCWIGVTRTWSGISQSGVKVKRLFSVVLFCFCSLVRWLCVMRTWSGISQSGMRVARILCVFCFYLPVCRLSVTRTWSGISQSGIRVVCSLLVFWFGCCSLYVDLM